MIQRKQTLYLLAVAIIGILMLFVPFQKYSQSQLTLLPVLAPDMANSNLWFPVILNVLVLIISVFTIFKFKNRRLQYKLANAAILLNVFIVGLFFLLDFINPPLETSISYTFGAFLPIIGAVFAYLAAHFIKKDELLVRNADRIR